MNAPESFSENPPPSRSVHVTAYWLGSIQPPFRARRWFIAVAEGAWACGRGVRWWPAAVVAGAAPPLVCGVAGLPGQQVLCALLLAPLLWACVWRDDERRGLGVTGVAFLAHAGVVAGATSMGWGGPELCPGGEAYWQRQWCWILSGWDPEYSAWAWVPTHVALIAAAVLYSYLSLGIGTLYAGFYQTDLMNVYTVRLAEHSADGFGALLMGWHLWSVLRGVGLLIITYEVVSLSLERMAGCELSTPSRRRRRWAAGLGFLVVDAATKSALLEPLREGLFGNLA